MTISGNRMQVLSHQIKDIQDKIQKASELDEAGLSVAQIAVQMDLDQSSVMILLGTPASVFEKAVSEETYQEKAKRLVRDVFNRDFPIDTLTRPAQADDFYVVWFAKVLGNWKAMVSTDLVRGHYYEVTYNGAKTETYVDAYLKVENVVVNDNEKDFPNKTTRYSY